MVETRMDAITTLSQTTRTTACGIATGKEATVYFPASITMQMHENQIESSQNPETRRMAMFNRARREDTNGLLVALISRKLRGTSSK